MTEGFNICHVDQIFHFLLLLFSQLIVLNSQMLTTMGNNFLLATTDDTLSKRQVGRQSAIALFL